MQINRATSLRIQYLLDEWVPPRIRDSRILMGFLMRTVLGVSAS